MRKILRMLIIIVIFCFWGYLGYGIYSKANKKERVAVKIATLPDFTFKRIDGKKSTKKHILGKALWLIFFHTDCEFCQMEAENIQEFGELNNLKIWLVSSENPDTLKQFSNRYALPKLRHVQVLNDSLHLGYHTFDVTSSPTSFLYSADGVLIKQYKGVVKVETVLTDLENGNRN
jgi:peroxiredoxin